MKQWTIGVDVGGTEIKFGLFDDKLKEKWSIPTNVSEDGSHILPEIAETDVYKRQEWMCRCRIQLGAVGIRISENMAGEFHNGHLHAKAETEERNIIFTGVLKDVYKRQRHTLPRPMAQPAEIRINPSRDEKCSLFSIIFPFRVCSYNLYKNIKCMMRGQENCKNMDEECLQR